MIDCAPLPFVDFSPPLVGGDECAEVQAALESGWLSTGPRVQRFEREFAAYVGSRHAVAVNSCTAALHLSLLACGIGPGQEVITTPLTFCATANVIVHAGATPTFADVDPVTMNLTPASAEAAITPRTAALMPVHFAGRPVDVDGFRALAAKYQLALVEDAAHAVEGIGNGRKIGTTADLTGFSFYATKNLTTGEGGMVTTDSDERASFIRTASLHGMTHGAWARHGRGAPVPYAVVMPGFKYNMTDLQAAIGIHQLAAIERRLERRERAWQRYDEGLAGLPITLPAAVPGGDRHARHLYTVLVDDSRGTVTRDRLRSLLHERGIATSVHFSPVHLEPYYRQRFGFERGHCPVAEDIAARTLSLPLSAGISDQAIDQVIDTLRELLA